MDNEIPLQGNNERDRRTTEKPSDPRMPESRDDDSEWSYSQRSCPPSFVMSSDPGPLESGAVSEGSKFEAVAGGIFAIEEEVLGAASLGSRIFLCDSRECDRGNDQGIHREARRI